MHKIFIDSKVLVGRVIGRAPEVKDCRDFLSKIKQRYSTILMPQTVLGESLAKIMEKSKDVKGDVLQFIDVINDLIDIGSNSPSLTRDVIEMTLKIQDEGEYNIGYCDAVLVSYALCSKTDCAAFIIDKHVHHSNRIQDRIKECGHNVKLLQSL